MIKNALRTTVSELVYYYFCKYFILLMTSLCYGTTINLGPFFSSIRRST